MSTPIRIKIARLLAPEWQQKEIADEAHIHALRENLRRVGWEKAAARSTLQAVIDRSTPGANSTVKAMVKIAQNALGREQ